MSEIKVNDYIRTENGEIFKIQEIYNLKDNILDCKLNGERVLVKSEKPSKDIIDLIEVGDYVNGNKVINILYTNDEKIPTIIKCINENFYMKENIKSIVTHEQFKNIEYKVGE